MDALSAFPVESALQAGVPVRSVPDEMAALRDAAERRLFPMLSEAVRNYVAERFRTYLTLPQLTSYAPALLHGDLSPDHYLTDARTGELTGVIDFGDAAVGDPDYDYVYVLEDGGEPFARQVMAHRGVADIDARIRKISLFVTFDQVRYLLDGVEAGDEDWIAEAVDILEADMRHNRT
jgi:aminoglycoside 2''-phosphotransferase